MADVVTRLKVESQEYDNKIKRATQGILQYAQKCREAGGTLEYLDDGVLEFVQSLGKMDTVATGTKQQLREMSNAITSLTTTYRGLSNEEKSSPFGQELAKQIDILTERAGQAKDAMLDVEMSIKNAASDTRMFDQLAGGMTMLTSTMQTAQGAAKLLGIELGDNVEIIAKLQAAMAVTQGLQQMQNLLQKQSALMQGINALQKEFNILAKANPYVLLASAVAAVAGAYLIWAKNGDKAKKVQEALNGELRSTREQLAQIDKDTDFSVGIAEASGKSWKAIHELRLEAARTKLQLADMNYDKLFASGASKEQMQEAAQMQKAAWDNVMKVLNEGVIHDVKMRNGGGGGSRGGGGSTVQTEEQMNSAKIESLTQEYINATDERRRAIEKEIAALEVRNTEIAKLKDMAHGKVFEAGELDEVSVTADLPPLMKMEDRLKDLRGRQRFSKSKEEYASYESDIRSVVQEIAAFKGENGTEDKGTKKVLTALQNGNELYSQAVGGISGIASGMQQMGIEIPQQLQSMLGVLQGISVIVSGIESLITIGNALGLFANGGIVPHAANGYFVGGNRFSGDTTPILANSGELVLNRAQQGVLAHELQSNNNNIAGGQPYVSGELVYLAINNYLRRSGRGEILLGKR